MYDIVITLHRQLNNSTTINQFQALAARGSHPQLSNRGWVKKSDTGRNLKLAAGKALLIPRM